MTAESRRQSRRQSRYGVNTHLLTDRSPASATSSVNTGLHGSLTDDVILMTLVRLDEYLCVVTYGIAITGAGSRSWNTAQHDKPRIHPRNASRPSSKYPATHVMFFVTFSPMKQYHVMDLQKGVRHSRQSVYNIVGIHRKVEA